ISDVLDLSRIEAGDLPLSVEPLHLSNVVGDAQAMVAEAATRANILMPEPEILPGTHILADRVRLRQVLVNLLSNAIKYNRPGGEVIVRASTEDGEIVIDVCDTGMGLSPRQVAHLFEPF